MSQKGGDLSWLRPGGAALKAAGYNFIFRYLSHDTTGKNISAKEATDYFTNGIDVGLVWETTANRALDGNEAGVSDAQDALAFAVSLGVPDDVALYFAVDFDATEAQQVQINEYFQGIAKVLPLKRIGAYGGYYPLKRLKTAGLATFTWQTIAWSGGQILDGVHIYQTGKQEFNGGIDIDEARQGDVGLWKAITATQPVVQQPAPPEQNVPKPATTSYTVVAGDTLSGIAARFGTTYQVLAVINGITDPNKINVGQVIKFASSEPTPQPNGNTYTVAKGDTLSGIGAKFGVDWHAIASANGLTAPYTIYSAQTLRIPGGNVPTPAPSVLTYVVQAGDTLGNIASRYQTTYQHLAQVNGITDPNKIYPGQLIKIIY